MASWQAWLGWVDWVTVGLLLQLQVAYLLAIGPLRGRIVYADVVKPDWRRAVLFTLGVLTIFLADGTALRPISERYLFSAHMAEHLLLTTIAVPLLLLGTPDWLWRWMLQHPLIEAVMRFCTRPLMALVLFNGALAFWHLPLFWELALHHEYAHLLQHVMYMVTAVFMWWPVLSPVPELPRLSYPAQMLYLFVQSLLPGAISAVLTFSDQTIYPTYAAAERITVLSPLADQQIAGLLMKVVGTVVLWLLASIIFFVWASRESRDSSYPRQERVPS